MSDVTVVKCDGCGKIMDANQPGLIYVDSSNAYLMININDSNLLGKRSRGIDISNRHFCDVSCMNKFVTKLVDECVYK
ncbi:MAG: hypothetical protein WC175_04170 [Candidatus Dojkabacteria bacterium]